MVHQALFQLLVFLLRLQELPVAGVSGLLLQLNFRQFASRPLSRPGEVMLRPGFLGLQVTAKRAGRPTGARPGPPLFRCWISTEDA